MAKVARLLEHVVPHYYRLNLDVDATEFRFRGLEELEFELTAPARAITLHASGLEFTLAELDGEHKTSQITSASAQRTVTFSFDAEIPAGRHTLSIAFSGQITDALHGFYRSRYERDGQEQWILTTQLEAIHAREVFACVDEPSAKAVFELTLTVPDSLTALANTDAVSEAPAGSGRKKVQFAPTPKMSTYLVAFIIGKLEHVEQVTPEGVMVRVFATPGRTGELAFALETGVRTLSFYNEYFGIPYPLSKLDMVALPDFAAGAMENWGLVTYRETALLLDPAKGSLSNKQRVAEVVLHELAHQWFGNLVTMAWWNDLWLNEGFATWMESYAKDKLFPEWQVWTEFIQADVAGSMEQDSLANTHPIEVEVDDPHLLDEIFDMVSYYKGSSVINMLHYYLGADTFRAGLQSYLKQHSYGNTITHDLWKALGKAAGKPVDEVMSTWTSQPGFPIVTFEDGQMTQRRFYSSPREAAKAKLNPATVWPIPFSALLPGGQATAPELVTTATADLPPEVVGSDWFKPNPGQQAYYRALYTEAMIEALGSPLRSDQLKPTDRFGIVNDVFATTEAGETNSAVALKLVQELREETDYVVWGGVTGGFGGLEAMVEDEPLRKQLEQFGGWLVQPNVERLGWQAKTGEPVFDTLMRPLVLQQAARFDNGPVTKEAKKRFTAYLEGAALDPDLRPAILYAAARHGGNDEFEAILERYRAESSPQMKMSLLGALGRFRKPAQIDRFLELGLSKDVRPQDLYIVLAWGFRNRQGRYKTWDWVTSNWDVFVKRYGGGGHMMERFPLYAGSGFATHEMAAKIKEFFAAHPLPSLKRPAAQAVEGVELRADWYERDRLKIQTFMDQWVASQK